MKQGDMGSGENIKGSGVINSRSSHGSQKPVDSRQRR